MDAAPRLAGMTAPNVIPGREDVELYTRTYRTVLRSSGEIQLRVLERAHLGMHSSLHPLGSDPQLDSGALLYALHRLPPVAAEVRHVLMGQSPEQVLRAGPQAGSWQPVVAPARRRRWWWDPGSATLAVALASSSDLDDLVPILVALQVEWNKAHALLGKPSGTLDLAAARERMGIAPDDWVRLEQLFGSKLADVVREISRRPMELGVRLVGGTQVGYARATREWWGPIGEVLEREGLASRPLQFVSSNAHALVNILSGVARRRSDRLMDWVRREGGPELMAIAREVEQPGSLHSRENFIYFAARRWFLLDQEERRARTEEERSEGIFHIEPRSGTDVAAQLIVLDRLRRQNLDPRLGVESTGGAALTSAPDVVLNIQYPLGLGAYHILRQVMEAHERVDGVYILGKAATLNADVGDVMVSDVVHDAHSGNTYWLNNCFSFAKVAPFIRSRAVLDRQRAVSVESTFLQNRSFLELYYRDAYTVVEMEAGPYLGAVFEAGDSSRYPTDEQVDLTRPPMEVGLIHYASDTPYTQARTLGARGLRFEGMEATYAGALAIAQRLLERAGVPTRPPGIEHA